jgi:hypothetical protein
MEKDRYNEIDPDQQHKQINKETPHIEKPTNKIKGETTAQEIILHATKSSEEITENVESTTEENQVFSNVLLENHESQEINTDEIYEENSVIEVKSRQKRDKVGGFKSNSEVDNSQVNDDVKSASQEVLIRQKRSKVGSAKAQNEQPNTNITETVQNAGKVQLVRVIYCVMQKSVKNYKIL